MASAGVNLATLSTAEREVINADLIACKLRRQSQAMGRDRSSWCQAQIAKLEPGMREMVMQAMRARAEQ